MNWIELTSIEQFQDILNKNASGNEAVGIYKHSTRCSISNMVKDRLERKWAEESPLKMYYLDLLSYRDLSGYIAEKLDITHESPQLIVLKGGKVAYHQSHHAISPEEAAAYS